MRKTVSVSIGGMAFILEEDAHLRLAQYIEKVRLNLGASPDADEIISDVEGRIAELLNEYLKEQSRQVINSGMVEQAISVMGAPEDYNVTGEPIKEKQESDADYRSSNRSLYRDTEDNYLGGVCAGLAHYLGWDPLAVRLIFVALLLGFGTGVLVYIIMWILVPPAETTAEKLRMHGEPVNLGSIKGRFETFGAEVKELGNKFKGNKKNWNRKGRQWGKRFENSLTEIGRTLAKVIGVFFIFLGAVLCFGVFTMFISKTGFPGSDDHFFRMIVDNPTLIFERRSDFSFIYWGAVSLLLLFIIGLIRSGVRLLFRIPLENRYLRRTTSVLILLSIGSIIFGGVKLGREFSRDESVLQIQRFEEGTDTIYISVEHDHEFSDKLRADESGSDELLKVKDKRIIFGYPELDIHRSENGNPRLELEKTAHGKGRIEAVRRAENINYPMEISGDSIHLQPVFSAPASDKFRAQSVKARLFVPDGTVIFISEGSHRILCLECCDTNISFWQSSPYSAKAFIMGRNGLRAL